MRELVVTELVTVDGVVEAPEEWQPPAGTRTTGRATWFRSTTSSRHERRLRRPRGAWGPGPSAPFRPRDRRLEPGIAQNVAVGGKLSVVRESFGRISVSLWV